MSEKPKKDVFKDRFYQLLRESDFESGCLSRADEYLEQCIEQEGPACFAWLYELYQDNYNNEYIITQLLGALARVPAKKGTTECILMVIESMQRESCAIVEKAVMVFENWEYTPAIPLLEHVHTGQDFIDNWVKDVVWDLKELEASGKQVDDCLYTASKLISILMNIQKSKEKEVDETSIN
jgi:hypothetical protein